MKVTFIGATHEVTGSCTLLQNGGRHYLVDMGMEQGVDLFENEPIPVAPESISAVFITENLFRIILYSANGIITAAAVRQALFMVPFMLAGLWLGMKSSSFLNEKTVKKCVIILLVISGALLILQNI